MLHDAPKIRRSRLNESLIIVFMVVAEGWIRNPRYGSPARGFFKTGSLKPLGPPLQDYYMVLAFPLANARLKRLKPLWCYRIYFGPRFYSLSARSRQRN